MSFAKNYLKQYNAASAWDSLGALGSIAPSAWQGGQNPLSVFSTIQGQSTNISNPRRAIGGTPYAPAPPAKYGNFGGSALDTTKFFLQAGPEDVLNQLAGKYFKRIQDYSSFF